MSDSLLDYYQKELAYVRRLGAEFARAYPRVAADLRIGPDSVEDPHVSRLVEAFAFLNARTRRKLEDDFPELTEALLSVLYPHYLRPVPSMAIVRFEAKRELTVGQRIPAGTALETEPIEGEPCRFRTCYPVTAWPIRIEEVRLAGRPLQGPAASRVPGAKGSLKIVLGCGPDTVDFAQLAPDSLRFYFGGPSTHAYALHEFVLRGTLQVCVASGPDDPDPILLDGACVRPVGYALDEGTLPCPARSFPGYRLLTELFAFPAKFLFFDLEGLAAPFRAKGGTRIEVYLYADAFEEDLEHNVGKESLALGCTPAVNLFRQRAEPVRLEQNKSEVRIIPDARRPLAMEVYSVDRVSIAEEDGRTREFLPFYSVRHVDAREPREGFWIASRRRASAVEEATDRGTEVWLSMADLRFDPALPATGVLDVETTCLTRDLPGRLPFGGGQPVLRLAEGGSALQSVTCMTPATKTLRPPLRHGALWRLLSHLNLGHLALTGAGEGAAALREILALYDFTEGPEARRMIEGILSVESREAAGRAESGGIVGICRGTEVAVELDAARFVGSGPYLFASVLERFLAASCAVNSFTRLVVTVRGREGGAWRWSPRSGTRRLL